MAESDLNGRNIVFQIKNADGTPFHNLVLHKAVVDSVVMSLGDKISGDVYYKDNTLDVSMGEYVTFNGVDYVLINPPTIVKEGMVSENGEMNGMTKYSFTFYHPMCMLANFPFSDVAVSSDEEQYKSQDKSFSWIGYPDDYIAKLNKNLQNTTWVVVKSERFPEEKDNELSEVLTFDNNTIADALKTGYETWEVPYIVGTVQTGQYTYTNTNNQVVDYYDEGKRFVVIFGLPFSEIYETPDDEEQDNPFVFHYGQGVGLKNNSRTPRNNKIITRIAGYGSEDNIPYGYPQIIWYGNQDWEYTAYSEIVTQETITNGILMATVGSMVEAHPEYEDSITSWYEAAKAALDGTYTHDRSASKTSGQYQYEWEVNIKDGYIRAMYNNEYYDHVKYYVTNATTMFDVFVPEDSTPAEGAYTLYWGIVGGAYMLLIHHPYTRHHLMPSIYSQCVFNKVSPYVSGGDANLNYNPDITLIDYYDAISDSEHQYPNPIVPSSPSYESHQFEDIKPELGYNIAIVDAYPINNDGTRADDWDSTMDEDGNYLQSYFKVTLPVLSFDIYACAAITQEMTLVMRGGACLGCSFDVQVDWEDYKLNFYDSDGNFAPDGAQRNLDKYPKSNEEQITVIVQKDLDTFGILMPNIYQKVLAGDTFVVIGISLPLSYITNAEERLDEESKSYMLENNIHYFDYPLKFDEFFLANNVNILQQIQTNSIIRFGFANDELELYVKQLTIKYGNAPLPQYDITLTDNVEITLNAIGQVADDVEKLSSLIALLRQSYNRNVWGEIDKKLSRVNADTAQGKITFADGAKTDTEYAVGDFLSGLLGYGGIFRKDADGKTYIEADKMYVRMKAYFDTVEVRKYIHSGGNRIASLAGVKCARVEYIDANGDVTDNVANAVKFRCYFRGSDGDETITNDFEVGDLAYCKNTTADGSGLSMHQYWRLVVSKSSSADDDNMLWIDLSNASGEYQYGSDIPAAQDDIIQLGNINDTTRQGAIIEYVGGEDAPSYQIYQGINDFDLTGKNYLGLGYNSETARAYLNVYGDAYIGAADGTTYVKYNQATKELDIKAKVKVGSTLEDGRPINDLGTQDGNLILNSGFTGEYETEDVVSTDEVSENTPMWSDPLKYWDATNVTVADNTNTISGKCAMLAEGTLTQTLGTLKSGWYMLSLVGNVTNISVTLGGIAKPITPTSTWARYEFSFEVSEDVNNAVITFNGNATIGDLMLTEGTISREWTPSERDNNKSLEKYYADRYLREAIQNGNTEILGGLILSQLIKVGMYRDNVMSQETGGMSGLFNTKNSPFLWGGGTMEEALFAIRKYMKDPTYQATEEEIAQMAQFVVTHGGRAILNDVILRGYIYALGGIFKGRLEIGQSFDKFIVDAETSELTIRGPEYVDDDTGLPDPSRGVGNLLKILFETDPDSLRRVSILRLLGNNETTLDANYGFISKDGVSNPTSRVGVGTYFHGFNMTTEFGNEETITQLGDGTLSLEEWSAQATIKNQFSIGADGAITIMRNGLLIARGYLSVDGSGTLKVIQIQQ